MRRLFAGLLVVMALSACTELGLDRSFSSPSFSSSVDFWRPISEPNTMLSIRQAQAKLDFDLSQCRCGIYPTNVPQPDLVNFQPDQQRMAETGLTITEEDGSCAQRPSLVVSECMRARGWETTKCSGRMPLPEGGSVCAGVASSDED